MTSEQAIEDAARWENVIAARCAHLKDAEGELADAFNGEAPALLAALQEEGFPTAPSAAWALREAARKGKSFGFYALEYLAQRATALGTCRNAADALALLSFLDEDEGYTDPDLGPAAFDSLRAFLTALSREGQGARKPEAQASDPIPGHWCGTDMGDD